MDSSLYFERIRAHLSQRQLAELVGVSQSSISFWERGLWEPRDKKVIFALRVVMNKSKKRKAS